MAKVAVANQGSSHSHQIGRGALQIGPMIKRKTTSELIAEQLKQTDTVEHVAECPVPLPISRYGHEKPETSRNPRYIETRMNEAYPAKKSRLRLFSGKENAKETISSEQPNSIKLSQLSSNAAKRRQQLSSFENSFSCTEVARDVGVKTSQTIKKCNFSAFRTVSELASGGDRPSGSAVDMNKALKGLVSYVPAVLRTSQNFGEPTLTFSDTFRPEFHVAGQKSPLDLTLKTKMRVVSSSSVNWIHRSILHSTYDGFSQFTSSLSEHPNTNSSSGHAVTSPLTNSKALHSWIYPQSNLPPCVISALTSTTAEGVEMDFLRKRQLAWEDSFRSLYYMFRQSISAIFYVCTSQFVVMFTNDGLRRTKQSCNAYISQSTRGLRSLLKEHSVLFSMPLCHSKVEHATTEDLVELSEIEKNNLGQARRYTSLADIDNTSESLLAFSGKDNVHGLYDFLLNYRTFLTFLVGVDVPVLYSPVPFQNASISAPEIRCMEMKKGNHIAAFPRDAIVNDVESKEAHAGFISSIEISDIYLPPWIISRICAIMCSCANNFEANFVTDRSSIGLNVGLSSLSKKPKSGEEDSKESSSAFGIVEARVVPCLHSGVLKRLKMNQAVKMTWPELIGLTAVDAEKNVKKDMARAEVEVVPPDCCITCDLRRNRVRLYVDLDSKVLLPG